MEAKNNVKLEGRVLGPITHAEYTSGTPIVNFKLLVQAGRKPDIFPVFAVGGAAEFFQEMVQEGDTIRVSGDIHIEYRKVKGAMVWKEEKASPLWIPAVSVKVKAIRPISREE